MALAVDRDRLVETFVELAKIPSPSGHEQEISQHIQNVLRKLDISCNEDAAGNLWCYVPGTLVADPIMLCGHMDTYTVEENKKIVVQVDGDIIRTDGSTILGADNKDNVAAILEAVTVLKDSGIAHRPFELVITTGEEHISVGAKQFDCKQLRSKIGIISDTPGAYGKITVSAPGQYNFDGRFYGLKSHSAYPDQGINALALFLQFTDEIARRGVRVGFRPLADGKWDKDNAMNIASVLVGHEYSKETRVEDFVERPRNGVPDFVEFRGEVRGKDMSVLAEQIEIIRVVFNEVVEYAHRLHRDLGTTRSLTKSTLHVQHNADAYSIDEESKFVSSVKELLISQGAEIEIRHALGGTDANIFSNNDIDTLVISGASDNNHRHDEQTRIPDLIRLAEFYTLILTSDKKLS